VNNLRLGFLAWIQDGGVKLPKCTTESREGEACGK